MSILPLPGCKDCICLRCARKADDPTCCMRIQIQQHQPGCPMYECPELEVAKDGSDQVQA